MKKEETITITALLLILLSVILIWFTSCMTVDKAKQVLKKKDALAAICATEYPVKTEYIKGDSVITFDTIYTGGELIIDTVVNYSKDTVIITKTVPVTKVVTKTVTIVDTVVKENTAAVEATKIDLNKCNDKYASLFLKYEKLFDQSDKYRKQRNTAYWIILGLLVLLFRKPLLKLVNPIFSKINLFK